VLFIEAGQYFKVIYPPVSCILKKSLRVTATADYQHEYRVNLETGRREMNRMREYTCSERGEGNGRERERE
jgi:hypothetical protein